MIVAAELARLLGAKDKNFLDVALAATARVYGLVVVTLNDPLIFQMTPKASENTRFSRRSS